jgi:hypothetical protein
MFGMIWLARGISNIVFHRPETIAFLIMGVVFWIMGVGLAFLFDHMVEYRSSPCCFAGALIGCTIYGFTNNHQIAAYGLTMIGLLILTINFYLIFVRKIHY